MSDFEAIVRWWLAMTAIAAALAPLVWWLGENLGPCRSALLRPLSLVAVTFVAWWPAALVGLPFTSTTVIVFAGLTGAASWVIWLRRGRWRDVSLRSLLVYEAVWTAAFLGYLWFRSFNPDIANTEKPMEIALLSSISRSADVPAPDPWFAGEPINYYYFGYQMLASVVKVTGVPAAVAFNLGLATVFASTLTLATGLGAFVARLATARTAAAVAGGALAAFFVTLAGNLETASRLVRDPAGTISAGWWDGIGWQASRIIYDHGVHGSTEPTQTINEFPAFSFVLGDLHPHVLAYPVLLATLALAVGMVTRPRYITRLRVAIAGSLAGILYATNSWDAPLAFALVAGAVFVGRMAIDREAAALVACAIAGAVVAAFPFAIHYSAPVGIESGDVPGWVTAVPVLGTLVESVAVVTWRPSSMGELLTVYGVWIALFVLFAAWALGSAPDVQSRLRAWQSALLIGALVLAAIAVAWAPAALLLGAPLALSAMLARFDERVDVRVLSTLFAVGFALALTPEFVYLQDPFGNRMNTIFKLGFQAWLLLALASAGALVVVLAHIASRLRAVPLAVGFVAVALALPYAPLSAADWADMGLAERTIDGAAYLALANPSEAAAIEWVSRRASAGDILVEAPGCGYQVFAGVPMNRVSAFTGVPTVIGWANHEGQWRRGQFDSLGAVMSSRQEQAHDWLDGGRPAHDGYATPRFVVLGALETSGSERCDLLHDRGQHAVAQLEQQGWVVAFSDGETRVFVNESDTLAGAAN